MKNEALKHSCAHLLAMAVKELFPEAKLGVGPPLEEGFYYDFGNVHFTEEDLPRIEAKMKELAKKNYPIIKSEASRDEAKKTLKDEKFKLELLDQIKGKITFYKQGNFIDLCGGNHVESTGKIKAFKLTKLAGAYWKGDQKNEQMQRIYGVVFENENELKEYLKIKEEAEKRDHVRLGKELDLFSLSELAPGFPFFHEKGAIIWNEIEKYLKELYEKNDYTFVVTPHILDKKIWLESGHWEHYKDNMYFTNAHEREFAIKPMNCPGHILIYKQHLHSYKDLPIRMAEFGTVYRQELSGVIHGLTRVRKITQDDAHIFCMDDQIEDEISKILNLIREIYKVFDFNEYSVNLSTKPENSMGDPKVWEKAERSLENALKRSKMKYEVKEGEGAFYGPKIDFDVKDALGRPWQLATVQLDFQMPERFDLSYDGQDGKKHRPVMIHRAIIGSFERFIGVLIEHYAGKFPLWLAPVQAILMTVTERNLKFAKDVYNKLKENGMRVELDDRNESIGKKVRDAQVNRIPLAITIGDKETENKTLAVRTLDGKIKFGVKVDDFIKETVNNIKNRKP